jgi:hypothetical protein
VDLAGTADLLLSWTYSLQLENGQLPTPQYSAYICTDQLYVIDRHGLCAVKQTEGVASDFYSWVKYSPRIGGDIEHTFWVPSNRDHQCLQGDHNTISALQLIKIHSPQIRID